jgi:hypothetical protein
MNSWILNLGILNNLNKAVIESFNKIFRSQNNYKIDV